MYHPDEQSTLVVSRLVGPSASFGQPVTMMQSMSMILGNPARAHSQ